MPEGATGRFTDVEDYQTSLPDVTASLVVTQPGVFEANLTWAKLPNLHLLHARETLARVAYILLPSNMIFASFVTRPGPVLYWNGTELPPDHMVLHGRRERMHQRATGASSWGLLGLRPSFFVRYGSALAGHILEPPATGYVVRSTPAVLARMVRLHARVAHLVETKPVAIGHPEVGRTLEHELVHALVSCLTDGEALAPSLTALHHTAIIARFESALANCPDRAMPLPELCASIDVSERTLRTCCAQLLGVDPRSYMRLRRLKLVRAALVRAGPSTTGVGEVAVSLGFREMGRFAAAYRAAFGETPSATLRRARSPPSSPKFSESA